MKDKLIKLSRTISHALRHVPQEYGIELDAQGWIEMDTLLKALAKKSEQWRNLTVSDLHDMAAAGEKQRFEFEANHIRAIYGHSTSKSIEYLPVTPPEILYHGTTAKAAALILREGLKPMKRQYVHLSPDIETATQVALRRTSKPVMLKIDAANAYKQGVEFYRGNDNVWLVKGIDSIYIGQTTSI